MDLYKKLALITLLVIGTLSYKEVESSGLTLECLHGTSYSKTPVSFGLVSSHSECVTIVLSSEPNSPHNSGEDEDLHDRENAHLCRIYTITPGP